jgi:RHS repeat-associated protein
MLLLAVLLGALFAREAQAFYNPSSGRWLSRDPIGEEGFEALGFESSSLVEKLFKHPNPYLFCANNPVLYADSLGLYFYVAPRHPIPPLNDPVSCALMEGFRAQREAQATGKNWTRYAHCLAGCRIAKECGKLTAHVAGLGKEIWDFIRCFSGSKDHCYSAFQRADFADNKQGMDCPKGKSCEQQCESLKGAPEPPGGPFAP